jgi:hypothetical protein
MAFAAQVTAEVNVMDDIDNLDKGMLCKDINLVGLLRAIPIYAPLTALEFQ